MIAFEDMSIMNRASSLANYELLGDASMMNSELSRYKNVSVYDIKETAEVLFGENNSNTMHYLSRN